MRLRLLKIRVAARRTVLGLMAIAVMLTLSSSRQPTSLEAVLDRGELRLATRPGPTTYYVDARGEQGFEYLLARDFADHLGVRLRVATTNSLNKLFNMLGGPRADFIGANLTVTKERRRYHRFSTPYSEVVQTLIYRRGTSRPRRIKDLYNRELVVIADSSHEERLLELREEHPDLTWRAVRNVEMIELMNWVHHGEVDFAVVDSTTLSAHQSLYPRAWPAFELSEPQGLAWAFPDGRDDSLVTAANEFLADARESGQLQALHDHYFLGVNDFSVGSSLLFTRRLETRLPTFEPLFREVAAEYDLDWHLLAAIAYQESHWDPEAVSPTGVRGLMMLTRDTAAELGIEDRTAPEQSLRGGAAYLMDLKRRLPSGIHQEDRLWFAMAAYNVGLGHLEDARVLTQRAGRDPNRWSDVRQLLPRLEQQKYYSTVRYGYARGSEPVIYVQNIRKYRRILQWYSTERSRLDIQKGDKPDFPARNWEGLLPL